MKCFFVVAMHACIAALLQCFSLSCAYAYEADVIKEVLLHVTESYAEDISDDDLVSGAIDGIMSKLDAASTYLTPDEFRELHELSIGEHIGVGLKVSDCTEKCAVSYVEPSGPADLIGIKTGDIIEKINGFYVAKMSSKEIEEVLERTSNDYILLELVGENNTNKAVKIKWSKIPIKSVSSKPLKKDGLLYIQIFNFTENTASTVRHQLFEANKKQKIEAVVLDLRDNPGGLLNQAIAVCDHFLNDGEIVSIRGKHGSIQRSYTASNQAIFNGRVVILINANTASAAEIVASALQEQGRAIIIGKRSFGKGSVQTIIPISNGGAIKITHALYYTPSGAPIQNSGIIPDIEVEQSSGDSDLQLRRAIEVAGEALHQNNENR